jgi:hypothetical protein
VDDAEGEKDEDLEGKEGDQEKHDGPVALAALI